MIYARTLLLAFVAVSVMTVVQATQSISHNAAVRRHASMVSQRPARRSVDVSAGRMVQKRQTAEQIKQAADLKAWDDDFHAKNAEWQQAAMAALASGQTPPSYDEYWSGKSGSSSSSSSVPRRLRPPLPSRNSSSNSNSNSNSSNNPLTTPMPTHRTTPRTRPSAKKTRLTLRIPPAVALLLPPLRAARPTLPRVTAVARLPLPPPLQTRLRTLLHRPPTRALHLLRPPPPPPRSRRRARLADRQPTMRPALERADGPTPSRTTLWPYRTRSLTRLARATPTTTPSAATRSRPPTRASPLRSRSVTAVKVAPGEISISLLPASSSSHRSRKDVWTV